MALTSGVAVPAVQATDGHERTYETGGGDIRTQGIFPCYVDEAACTPGDGTIDIGGIIWRACDNQFGQDGQGGEDLHHCDQAYRKASITVTDEVQANIGINFCAATQDGDSVCGEPDENDQPEVTDCNSGSITVDDGINMNTDPDELEMDALAVFVGGARSTEWCPSATGSGTTGTATMTLSDPV